MALDSAVSGAVVNPTAGDAGRFLGAFVPCASISGQPWLCVYTRPKCELRVEHKLRSEGAPAWLPQEAAFEPTGERRIRALFPRYLFMQMLGERLRWGYVIHSEAGEELGAVLRSADGRPLRMPPGAIERLWSQCQPNGVIYPPEPRRMRRGDRGRVLADGGTPFSDLEGICTRARRERVWLLLGLLGRQVEVPFPREAVEVVD